ncbi:Zn-ribbon domain-containing OB-fold protein [Sinorhizobium fredii]|uniref:Zn-ribbon domain-containing OB-fold protein n=1 Tax=Rhizobium fredii TaxID=380 RepID=UPI0004B8CBEB|nr:OB-fold domain-containing protein [Sinorhizobium fredii]
MDSIVKAAEPPRPAAHSDGMRLEASRDKESGKGVFPRIRASSPVADRYEPIMLSPEATIYSFTVIHPNPKSGLKPFALVYADFAEDVRVFGRLALAEGGRPRIGAPVRVTAASDATDVNKDYLFVVAEENVQ